MTLTESHRTFCRLVVEGTAPKEAYKQTFTASERAAGPCASRLMSRPEIQLELEKLRAPLYSEAELHAIWPKNTRMAKLQKWAEEASAAGRYEAAVRCIAELNKLDGAYTPEKIELDLPNTFDTLMQDLLKE